MTKASKLLNLIKESKTSTDGDVSHYHPEIVDDNGVLTSLGPANNGPKHKHGVEISKQGDIKILPASNTDPQDPSHSHAPSDAVKKSTKDAYLKTFDKDAE